MIKPQLKVGLLLLMLLAACTQKEKGKQINPALADNARHVNTFIGTGGHGHTFPGATTPNGMVQLSPDTRTLGWDACGGYHYSDSSILGFSHTHLSGTGIGDMGDILFTPFAGNANIEPGSPEDPDSGYRSRFSHNKEQARPGYYTVDLLDYGITAELTATARAGFHRYTYSEDSNQGVIIDLKHTIHGHRNTKHTFQVINDREIAGYKMTKGWAQNHHVYFHAKFNKPFTFAFYDGLQQLEPGKEQVSGKQLLVVLDFDKSSEEPLLAKVGISSVDSEGAKKNLEQEIEDWEFDRVKEEAYGKWKQRLSKISVKGGSSDQKKIFYSALYHTSVSPYIFNDVDGRYRGIDQQIRKTDKNIYTVFSLWDTFRAFHPLMNIIEPELNSIFIETLLTKYENGGILPKWELAANYTGTMIGYHAIPVIVDAFLKGNRDFDAEKAYQAMVHASAYDTTGIYFPSDRVKEKLSPMAKKYNEELGFIPSDLENESVSKALEYAYNDWCIAQMAKALGKEEDYQKFMERAGRYKKYFDPETGFMRGVNRDGSFREPFDPKFSRHREDDYVEGNAWQWTWFVPHDVSGLVGLMGGETEFVEKIDELFATSSEIKGEHSSSDISGLIGQYAHGNEPSHHITHLYNFVGQPWKTQALTDSIMSSLYFNDPNGLSGNEDCGQMSAWYILNAMGFYSFCPGATQYSITRPVFDEVEIKLADHKTFTIKAPGNTPKNKFIQSIRLNGKPLDQPFFNHDQLLNGGVLELQMGAEKTKMLNSKTN
ncbi:MAG: GH92 family glycosyl hydrolase [Cyclobacteriaceae bacterium]